MMVCFLLAGVKWVQGGRAIHASSVDALVLLEGVVLTD